MRAGCFALALVFMLGGIALAQRGDLVHSDSSFRSEVRRLIARPPLDTVTMSARSFHNDVEIWVNRNMTLVIDAASCDEQRDFAASLWLRWSEMDVGSGAGVTIKSYTGRVIASAEQGFSGPRFHC